jgi:ribonuclease HI
MCSIVNAFAWSEQFEALLKERERIMELEAENAKLREDNDRLIQAIEDLHNVSLEDELVQLENENAKLRELLQRTWDAFHDATAREFVSVKNELRELGVEVDE